MTFEAKKDTDRWFAVRLVDSVDSKTPETGKATGDITVVYGFEGATGETGYAQGAAFWKEQGSGNYWLAMGASEFTSEGKYIVNIECAGCDPVNFAVEVYDKNIGELIDDAVAIKAKTDGLNFDGSNVLADVMAMNANVITAAAIANAAIDNATFAADVGSTAYASNIIALAVRKALDELNLDHLLKVVTAAADMTTEVVDNTILSRILANGDTSAFVPSTDGLQAIRDAIAAAADIIYVPDASSTVTDGTVQSGTFASTAADDGTRWVVQLETDNDINVDVTCEFNMGPGRVATEIGINGYYDAGGVRSCQVYAWNYTTASWDKLSAAGADTEMRNRSTDKDYLFSLNAAHTDRTTAPGEVKIRFYTDGGGADEDDLHLDYVYVDGAAEGGTSPAAIAQAVHGELDSHLTHISCFTGSIRYVHGTSGDDANSGEYPDIAFATISAAVSASSPGDMIRVFATTYSEAVVLAGDGLELWCEIGTVIDGNTGVPLTVSGDSCRVIGAHLTPDAGQIGCIVSGTDGYLELCENHGTGLMGFQFAATAARSEVIRCVANNFTGTGFDVKGFSNVFDQCVARGDGGTEKGFHLSDTAAHRNVFTRCKTVDCATAGWTVDAGADDNLFDICSDSAGCGTKVDSGSNNTWRGFLADDASAAEIAAILLDTGTDGVVLAANAITAAKIAAAACNKIADYIIRRGFENACDSSDGDTKSFRSLLGAIAKLVNKLSLNKATGKLTITEDDDTTTLGTQTVTQDATAEPITAMDTD